jgi:hypothetical protein
MQPRHEVADILRELWPIIEQNNPLEINSWQKRTLSAIKNCRTAALGGHIDQCSSCGHLQISYNSCRNRHCPKCQGHKREQWIQARESELLPTAYFHVIFTLPQGINPLALHQPKLVYDILFKASWQTIEAFSKDTKWVNAKMGMIAVLHTWGQTLSLHPHLHCIVPGGGITRQGKWRSAKVQKGKFLFPVKAMSKVFRAKYCSLLHNQAREAYELIRSGLWSKPWVVYAKRPFGGPKQVVEYLGRYTHKIAISNHRIKDIDNEKVTFNYKDYRQGAKKQQMTLTHQEFIRRFAQHILPKRFVRIRHYGILSSTWKRQKLKDLQQSLDYTPIQSPLKSKSGQCPCCKNHSLKVVFEFDARGPPQKWIEKLMKYNQKKTK